MGKENSKKFIMTVAISLLMTVAFAITAFAGTWQQDLFGWRYVKDDGTYQGAGWLDDNGSWYVFGDNGYMRTGWYNEINNGNIDWYYLAPTGEMQTGWVYDNGNWYFMSTKSTDGQTYGKMVLGDAWIDSYNYYFDPLTGTMARSQTINGSTYSDDGWRVGTDGSPVTQIVYLSPVNVYSSKTAAQGSSSAVSHSSSGGSGGGGSSRSSSSGSSSSRRTSTSSARNRSTDTDWINYSDMTVRYISSDFTNGNYGMMTSAQIAAVNEAIQDFKDEYIESGMSDFEKEMMIIQYIVENCDYKIGENFTNSTAYSVLINGQAQCSGYADAFLQMAKSCGLNARYVTTDDHAWNLVQLDGDWYHVDTTWEDGSKYGFGNLKNKYINLEDSEIKQIPHHESWSPTTIKCNGYKYGPDVVDEYLRTGIVDTSLGISYADYINNATVASADNYEEGTVYTGDFYPGNILYTLDFDEEGGGHHFGTVSYCYLNERVKINYPDGYTYVGLGEGDYSVTDGSGIFTGDSFMVLSGDERGYFTLRITVKKIEDESEAETEDEETDITASTYSIQQTPTEDESDVEEEAGEEETGTEDEVVAEDETTAENEVASEDDDETESKDNAGWLRE